MKQQELHAPLEKQQCHVKTEDYLLMMGGWYAPQGAGMIVLLEYYGSESPGEPQGSRRKRKTRKFCEHQNLVGLM